MKTVWGWADRPDALRAAARTLDSCRKRRAGSSAEFSSISVRYRCDTGSTGEHWHGFRRSLGKESLSPRFRTSRLVVRNERTGVAINRNARRDPSQLIIVA